MRRDVPREKILWCFALKFQRSKSIVAHPISAGSVNVGKLSWKRGSIGNNPDFLPAKGANTGRAGLIPVQSAFATSAKGGPELWTETKRFKLGSCEPRSIGHETRQSLQIQAAASICMCTLGMMLTVRRERAKGVRSFRFRTSHRLGLLRYQLKTFLASFWIEIGSTRIRDLGHGQDLETKILILTFHELFILHLLLLNFSFFKKITSSSITMKPRETELIWQINWSFK